MSPSRFFFPATGLEVAGQALLLAIDDVSLLLKRNLCYYLSKPAVRQEPVLTPSRDNPTAPDNLAAHFYGTVLFDEGKYRMWYYPCHLDPNPDWPPELKAQAARWPDRVVPGPLCYAESADGLHWEKPKLGQLLFKGSRENNALNLPSALTGDACVIKDESDPDPNRRYKMAFWTQHDPYDFPTMRLATSPDGLVWQAAPQPPIPAFLEHASFYQHNGFYFANSQAFLPGESGRERGRQGAAWISADFDHWLPECAESFALPASDDLHRDEVHLGVGAASLGNALVGLYCIWHNDPVFARISGDLGLVVSNDGLAFREPVKGYRWLTTEESPVTPVPGKEYRTILCQANGILNAGDETRIYHGRWRNADYGADAGNPGDYHAEVALATLPRDRWGALGLSPNQTEGSVWSTPVTLPAAGGAIFLNADGITGMQVEVADARFQLLPGFSGEQSGHPVGPDGFDCPVTWSGRSLTELGGQTVRFRVLFQRAGEAEPRLYALSLRGKEGEGTARLPFSSDSPSCEIRRTGAGTTYAVRLAAALPAPTLLTFAGAANDTLTDSVYGRTGRILGAQGWNVVSLDLPGHGAEQREGEPTGLDGWRARVEKGEDIVAAWCRRVDNVVTTLVEQGLADPNRLVAEGTSRGGFMACQAAAAIPRLRAVAAFAPVTDLLTLREFAGLENDPLTRQLALVNQVQALADRAVWLIIGNDDARVGTDKSVALCQGLIRAAVERKLEPRITLQVVPVPGHTSLPEWHDQAAAWLLQQVE